MLDSTTNSNVPSSKDSEPSRAPVLELLADIEPEEVCWLWPGRIARGKLTLLCGDPGLGKSLITLDIAARVSRSAPFPGAGDAASPPAAPPQSPIPAPFIPDRSHHQRDQSEHQTTYTGHQYSPSSAATRHSALLPHPQSPAPVARSEYVGPQPLSSVILLSAEDDVADTIRPRLEAHGADLRNIVSLRSVRQGDADDRRASYSSFSLRKDIEVLAQAIEDTSWCNLVVIDPLSAYLTGIDSHRDVDVRRALVPLAALAADYNVAVLAVSHLNKAHSGPAIYRTIGSLAFTAAARAVWMVTKDPHTDGRRLMLPVKNNVGSDDLGLAYRIGASAPGGRAVVRWETLPVRTAVDEVLAQRPRPGQDASDRQFAEAWLRDTLTAGPVRGRDIIRDARDNGIALRTLHRAKANLGIKVRKLGFGGGWEWSLGS